MSTNIQQTTNLTSTTATRTIWDARRALIAGFSAFTLDGFDFMIFTLALPTIMMVFHLSAGEAGLLASATLFISAIGGLISGIVTDYWGRVKTLAAAIFLYALFTGLTAFAQSYTDLFIYRALEGFGFGGTWAAAAALVAESAPPEKRGRWLGWMQSSWGFGWALSLIVWLTISSIWDPVDGWRILFILGALPALLVVWLIKKVKEPQVWLDMVAEKRLLKNDHLQGNFSPKSDNSLRFTFFQLFAPDLIKRTLLGLLLATGAQFGYYSIFTFLPTYLRQVRNLSVVGSGPYLGLVIFGGIVGYWASGYLNDRWGRRKNFAFFSICSALMIIFYTRFVVSNEMLIILCIPLGFFSSGILSGFGPYLAELFPTRVRATAQGLIYNGGRAGAAFAPAIIGYLVPVVGDLGISISLVGPIAYLCCVVAVLFLPETKGQILTAGE